MKLALAVAPLLLGLVALACFDLADDDTAPKIVRVEQPAPTRLIVLLIDSLDVRDVAAMPAFRMREVGLHGEVRACVDGVTIPCVTAMIRGYDRASGFSPLRNFGAARELVPHSLLGLLQDQGLRVGYFGDPLLARALEGLAMVRAAPDEEALAHALEALPQLDVAIIHLLAIDEAAHKFGAEAPEYERARAGVDDAIVRTFARLEASDHVVVLGDHGHELSGRHSADVGTATFAAYYGPRFARTEQAALVMTDHAPLWARLFGFRWSEPTLADDYFARRPLRASALESRDRKPWPLLLACAIAGAVALSQAGRWRLTAVLATLLMALEGVLATYADEWLASIGGALGSTLLIGVLGALVWRSDRLSGSLLFALPTAEPTAGIKAPMLWLVGLLVGKDRRAVLGASVLLALAMVRVQAFLPRDLMLPKLDPRLGDALPPLILAAAVYAARGLRPALAVLTGAIAARLLGDESRWLLLPCALVLPLAFASLRLPLFEPLCFVLPIACGVFFPRDSANLSAVCAAWLLWALIPRALLRRSLALRTAAFVTLMWLSFWTAMSTRIGGIDYDFYFRWLPAAAGAMDQAGAQGLLTAAKCILPVVFGVLLAPGSEDVLDGAAKLTAWRLALTIVFVASLSMLRVDLQQLYDATQEVAFWLLMYAVLGLVSAAHQRARRETSADSASN